jgi:AraC-like DNA-binding protein
VARGIQIEAVDAMATPAIAIGNDYPDGHMIAPHMHRRGQLISSARGTLILGTPDGALVMPPQRGMWIPSGICHEVRAIGSVSLQSVYLDAEASAQMPKSCQVVSITSFMRSLISRALDMPADHAADSHAGALMSLIRHEMKLLPILPLSLTFPTTPKLAKRCRDFLQEPEVHETLDDWASALGLSRRHFSRLFRRETGLSFGMWRQEACLFAALPKLAAGLSVTTVAMELGYNNPAAFSAMFKRMLGTPPHTYFRSDRSPGVASV